MPPKKEYRSAVRSRRMIRQAFMELLREKPFEKITVTDIVNRADINRSTFYAHYPDVYGLVDEVLNEIINYSQQFWEELKFGNFFQNPRPILQKIVGILEENRELYKLLGQSDMAQHQLSKIKNIFIQHAVSTAEIPEQVRTSVIFSIRIRFFIGGIFDVYTQWLYGDLACSLEEITNDFADMIVKSAEDFI